MKPILCVLAAGLVLGLAGCSDKKPETGPSPAKPAEKSGWDKIVEGTKELVGEKVEEAKKSDLLKDADKKLDAAAEAAKKKIDEGAKAAKEKIDAAANEAKNYEIKRDGMKEALQDPNAPAPPPAPEKKEGLIHNIKGGDRVPE